MIFPIRARMWPPRLGSTRITNSFCFPTAGRLALSGRQIFLSAPEKRELENGFTLEHPEQAHPVISGQRLHRIEAEQVD
jgi:hypothetical protein